MSITDYEPEGERRSPRPEGDRAPDTEPACPSCGSDAGYSVSDRANGWVQYWGDWSGSEERANGEDGLSYTRSKTVICDACGRRSLRPRERRSEPIDR